ncbi:MFS general substrate transporter [Penicillium riverlandense]|uniref:MFS general substrate transporter n=1 Tax=Penicillium riverlandense TaxID=1903569 RepID=UPI002548DB15|nr:MFS general substrate transporter [Penicillium riverlandense]KAJ5818368.1 MFS general substrate transporter [Penicillium riverlandense]
MGKPLDPVDLPSEYLPSEYLPSDSEYQLSDVDPATKNATDQIQTPKTNDSTSQESLLQTIRRYPRVVGYVFGLLSVFLLTGYDTCVVGTIPSVPQFQIDYGEQFGPNKNNYIIPSLWLSLWNALPSIGQMAGGIAAGSLQDRVGRRWPLAVGSVLSAVAVAVTCLSSLPADVLTRRVVFLVAEIVQSFALGMALAAAQTYISETVPTSLRGPAMALLPAFDMIGQLLGSLVVLLWSGGTSSSAYMVSYNSMWPFSAIPLLVAVLLPESPSYLVRKGDLARARRSLKKLHTARVDSNQLLEELKETIESEKKGQGQKVSYRDCFRDENKRRTMISMFGASMPVLFGTSLLASASYFLQTLGMDAKDSLLMLVLGVALALIGNGVGVWLTSCVGRRRLILVSLSITTVVWLSMGISGCFSGIATAWYAGACMVIVSVVCSMGAWPACFAVVGETSSLHLRAKTQGLCVVISDLWSLVFSIVLPYLYNSDAADLGGKLGFIYFTLGVFTVFGTWWMIPEMKGRNISQIDFMFRMGLSTRMFRGWSDEVESEDTRVLARRLRQ